MENHDNKSYIKWGVTIFLTAAAILLFYYFVFHITEVKTLFNSLVKIISPILIGLVMAYLITPIINFLEQIIYLKILKNKFVSAKNKKRIRAFSIVLSMVFLAILFYEFFAMVIPELKTSVETISSQLNTYINNLEAWVNDILRNRPQFNGIINDIIEELTIKFNDWVDGSLTDTLVGLMPQINDLIKTLTSGVVSILTVILNTLIGLIISFYLLYSKEEFAGQAKKIVYAFAKKETANSFIHNMRFINKTFLGFIVGKIVDSIIIGLLCFILTTIIGTPYPILISVVVGVTNVIPFFGPYIGAIPCAFLVLMVDPLKCLYFVIMIILLQQFDGNILGPKILGESTGISGFWVIVAITVFGGILKIPGMIVGVPLFAVIYSAVKAMIKSNLDDKQLPKHTEDYIKVDYVDENNKFMQIPPEEVHEIVTRRRYGLRKLQYKIEPVEEEINKAEQGKEAKKTSQDKNIKSEDDSAPRS